MHYSSVSWLIISLKCSDWNIVCFGQKEPMKVQFFRLLSALTSLPNSLYHFWNHKVRVYSNFALLFSIMKDNSSVFFQLKPYILWTKVVHRCETFRLLSVCVKIHQLPYVTFENKNFEPIYSVVRDNSSELFWLKLYMSWTKGA